MDIIIDLKNEKRSKVNVEMSWKISVAERKDNFWDKLPWIRNNQNIERHVYIAIQNISVVSVSAMLVDTRQKKYR